MILVPNRQQPLSGSKFIIVLLIGITLMGCASSSISTKSPNVIKPDVKKEKETEVAAIPVDTIQWTEVSEEDATPISTESKVGSFILDRVKKDRYKVALLLPVRAGASVPALDDNNKKYAEFYAGMKLSGRDESEVDIDVKTYYTNRSVSSISQILSDFDFYQPDVIIGGFETEVIRQTADWARTNRVPMISPWKSSNRVTEDNVFFLQMRPSTTEYYEKMLTHVNYNYAPEKVCIIGREGADDSKIRVLRRINERMASLPETQEFDQMLLSQEDIMETDSIFYEKFEEGIEAFVIPHFAWKDEVYVYSCLRKLYAEKGENEFYVYTMPLVLNSDRVDVNILKNLNTRTVEFRYPDKRNPEVQAFKESYYNTYGWLPTEHAYYGHDMMKFISYGLANHGQYFHYYMAGESLDLMQMKIAIEPYNKNKDDDDRPDFMSNKHLYIIEYDTDHFVIKDIK